MNREDIIQMAREAGMNVVDDQYSLLPFLERFAALVAAAERAEMAKHCAEITRAAVTKAVDGAIALEREACAKVCDDHERQRCEAWKKVLTTGGEVPNASLSAVSAAIRARGQS